MSDTFVSRRGALGGMLGGIAGALLSASGGGAAAAIMPRYSDDPPLVHDPAILKAGNAYYMFSTTMSGPDTPQIPWRWSPDLTNWHHGGFIFPRPPQWLRREIPKLQAIWAPDISYYAGKYWLYFTGSIGGKNTSAIGLLTNRSLDPKSPDYAWKDEGMVFRSYAKDPYNAIDPNHIVDEKGNRRLAFGSFWSGLKLIGLDKKTGKPGSHPEIHALASRGGGRSGLNDPIEAPFLWRHGDYYYLFAAYDFCCRGANSTYYTAVGRSRQITGPYVDDHNTPMLTGGAKVLLSARNGRWHGQGGASVFTDGRQDYLVFHAYDAELFGASKLRIAPIVWKGGWPEVQI